MDASRPQLQSKTGKSNLQVWIFGWVGRIPHASQLFTRPECHGREPRIKDLAMTRIDLTQPTVFEKGCVYLVPLMEHLNLTSEFSAKANPKSTTGRLDIFTRLICDGGTEFERVPRV